MTEKELQIKLFKWRLKAGHKWIVGNSHPYGHEIDLFSVTNKGYGIDHEIKCSYQDFRSEIKSAGWTRGTRNKGSMSKYWKHYDAKNQHANPDTIYKSANYFYFVSEIGIIPADEIPSYAGLIWFLPSCESKHDSGFEIIVRAPRLHTRPITLKVMEKVAVSLMYKAWRELEPERQASASS